MMDQRNEEFVRLLTQNQRRVYAYILTMIPNRSNAEDVMQETSVVLWQKFDQFKTGSNFAAWACRVAMYEVQSFRRNQQKHPLQLRDSFIDAIADEALNRIDELEDRYHALADCLDKLSGQDRELISHRYRSEQTVAEVAKQVGRPVEGLYKAYQRIRHQLAECVDRTISSEDRR